MKEEKEYIIKLGDLYLTNFKVNMYEIKTEFIEEIKFSLKERALLFNNKEEAELLVNKLYILTGMIAEVIEND